MTTVGDWAVAGSYFEACSCDAICPCRSVGGRPGGRSTTGTCEFALSWHVEQGHGGRFDLAGLDLVLAGFYRDDDPGSPWEIVAYVDERADADQARWMSDIFTGRVGGHPGATFGAQIATVHSVRSARIELEHQPGWWAMGVEGHVRVTASQVVACDETVACGIPGLDRPGQELIADVLAVDDVPLAWEVEGRCAFATDFEYGSAI